ncbi:MAG: cell division protein FtsZ [Sulfuricurvum sp.]|uniref:cell division protein FtsZ n=1 Tax=Sulfuricurvum sp. TaxID=2025608 RepID=UPI0027372E8B|nr:cell division protein FtsZ [Sulfuricurvum sp.]MDP3292150.1 cell division protein FtsZ [Sulfuricurvum sp.]
MKSITINESATIQENRIIVVGFGSSGSHIIDTMIIAESKGVEFIAINVESDYENIRETLENANIVFITGGLGGQRGQTFTPLIAKIAKNAGALTIGVVTKPFNFEGKKRHKLAEETLIELKKVSDSVVVIPNDKLLSIIDPKMMIPESYKIVDRVLARTINGIIGVILASGETDINLDIVDLQTIMSHRGTALAGIGESQGEKAAYEAIISAAEFVKNDNLSIKDASGVLVHFTMHPDFYFMKLCEAMDFIHNSVNESADVIFGTTTDETLPIDFIRVTLVASGVEKSPIMAINNVL